MSDTMSGSKFREFWIDHDQWYSKEEKEFNDRTCSKNEWNGENLVHVIEHSAYLTAVKALKKIGVCECDAKYNGVDDAEYLAKGCHYCVCKPDWRIAEKALKELGEV